MAPSRRAGGKCGHAAPSTTPRQRQSPQRPPLQRYAWDVYRAAARAKWIGRVIASTANEAVEAAAVEFNTDAWKLIAVRRYEIA